MRNTLVPDPLHKPAVPRGKFMVQPHNLEVIQREVGASNGSGSAFFINSCGGTASVRCVTGPGVVEHADSMGIKHSSAK